MTNGPSRTGVEARRNNETPMTRGDPIMPMLFSCFVIYLFSYGQQAYCRPGHETAPSNKPASPFSRCRTKHRAILVSQCSRRCLQLQKRPSFRREKVSTPDDNQRRLSSAQDRTQPTRPPCRSSWVSTRVFPDKTFVRVPCPKQRWQQMRLL